MREPVRTYVRLLHDGPFRWLVGSKLGMRIATDALLYALLVRVVQQTTSARYTTLLVLAYTLPAVLFGLAGGAAAEASSLRRVLVAGQATRAALAVGMLALGSSVWWIYALVFSYACVGQIVGPAEASALPRMVPAPMRAGAHSFLALTTMVGGLFGAAIIGPIVLKLQGAAAVITVCAVILGVATVCAANTRIPHLVRTEPAARGSTAATLLHGWRALRASPDAFLAVGYLTMAGGVAKVLISLAPYYTKDVLGLKPENAVFVAIPASLGAVAALIAAPILAHSIGLKRALNAGFLSLLGGLLSVGALIYFGNVAAGRVDIGAAYLQWLGPAAIVLATLIMVILVGFGGALLGIIAATTLNHEIAPASQARAFSTSTNISAAMALLPLFTVAAVANLVGVRALLLGLGLATLAGSLLLRAATRGRSESALPSPRVLPHLE